MQLQTTTTVSDRRCRIADSRCKEAVASTGHQECRRSSGVVRGTAPSTVQTPQSRPLDTVQRDRDRNEQEARLWQTNRATLRAKRLKTVLGSHFYNGG